MFDRDTLLSTPLVYINKWTFDEKVANVFLDMAHRSIPGYSNIIFITGMLAKRFVKSNTKIYDLGCSLGSSTLSVYHTLQNHKDCKIIAVDNSSAMIERFNFYVNSHKISTSINLLKEDIRDINIQNASMVILNFTLQFLTPSDKQALLKKIYRGLNFGGLLVLSEKFFFEDTKIEKLFCSMYHDFKRANGYSELEIIQKQKMLKNVMFTDSIKTHKIRLKKAGFTHIKLWFQCMNFGSLIALKNENKKKYSKFF